MEIKNNPVGRLYDIYCEARGHNEASITQDVWVSVLGAPAGNVGELLRLIADVIRLQGEAKQALIDGVEGDPTIFLTPFEKLDQLFSRIQLSAQWVHSKQYLDDTTLSALAFGNHFLQNKYNKSPLTAYQASEFIKKLDELLRECLDSELPEPLMKLFQKNLESLRSALISYKILGIQGLEDEIDRTLGALSRHGTAIQQEANDTARGFMKSVFEAISNINESIQLTETTAKIATAATLALLPLFQ